MTQKNETPAESKAATETKNSSAKLTETLNTSPEQEKPALGAGRGIAGNLSPELTELVTELRDTVKRIDPRRHTEKTLRRALSNVSDILADIDKLYQQD
jgi:ABC-type transporter Mla subunit MlaD